MIWLESSISEAGTDGGSCDATRMLVALWRISRTTSSVLLIGGGALGGMVADLLVRGGLRHLTILDNDDLEAGNLGRHVLGMDNLGKGKAHALARKLNLSSPHANVESIHCVFPPRNEEEHPEPILIILGGNPQDVWHVKAIVFRRAKTPVELLHRVPD